MYIHCVQCSYKQACVRVRPAVPVEAAGGSSGHERAARQSVRAAGRNCQRAGTHQPHAGDGQQGLAAKDREVSGTRRFPPFSLPPSAFTSLNLFPFLQVDGDHRDFAEPGGVSLRAGGAASLHGAAPSQEGEEGATQDHPLFPLPEGALHSTQVLVIFPHSL